MSSEEGDERVYKALEDFVELSNRDPRQASPEIKKTILTLIDAWYLATQPDPINPPPFNMPTYADELAFALDASEPEERVKPAKCIPRPKFVPHVDEPTELKLEPLPPKPERQDTFNPLIASPTPLPLALSIDDVHEPDEVTLSRKRKIVDDHVSREENDKQRRLFKNFETKMEVYNRAERQARLAKDDFELCKKQFEERQQYLRLMEEYTPEMHAWNEYVTLKEFSDGKKKAAKDPEQMRKLFQAYCKRREECGLQWKDERPEWLGACKVHKEGREIEGSAFRVKQCRNGSWSEREADAYGTKISYETHQLVFRPIFASRPRLHGCTLKNGPNPRRVCSDLGVYRQVLLHPEPRVHIRTSQINTDVLFIPFLPTGYSVGNLLRVPRSVPRAPDHSLVREEGAFVPFANLLTPFVLAHQQGSARA